jgi:hypothetical protein
MAANSVAILSFEATASILLGVLFWMLQSNGVVTVRWEWSSIIYLILIAVFEWSFFNWESARGWDSKKKHSINIVAITILGLLSLAGVRTEYAREHDHDPRHVPVSQYDADQFSKTLNLIQNEIVSGKSGASTMKSIPGVAVLLIARINSIPSNGRAYIIDIGGRGKSRLSVYLINNLVVFSVTDDEGEVYSVRSPIGPGGIPYQLISHFQFEFGSDDSHSTMTILANAKIVGSLSEPFHIDIAGLRLRDRRTGNIVLGADLQKHNGGVFDAFSLAIFSRTFTSTESDQLAILALQPSEIANRYFLRFNGRQWGVSDLSSKDRNMHLSDESMHMFER